MKDVNWLELTSDEQLKELKEKSTHKYQVIFKHSTRCAISSLVKNRLEKSGQFNDIDFYLLDLLKFRPISEKIAKEFSIYHESPQVLLIKDGKCIYDESHTGITMSEIEMQATNN